MIEPLRGTECNYGTSLKKPRTKCICTCGKCALKLPERKIGTLLKVLIWVKETVMNTMFISINGEHINMHRRDKILIKTD